MSNVVLEFVSELWTCFPLAEGSTEPTVPVVVLNTVVLVVIM